MKMIDLLDPEFVLIDPRILKTVGFAVGLVGLGGLMNILLLNAGGLADFWRNPCLHQRITTVNLKSAF